MIRLTGAMNPNIDAPLEVDESRIEAFELNTQDPNGGSLVVMENGATYAVRESVDQIANLMHQATGGKNG